MYSSNFNVDTIYSPVDHRALAQLLEETGYNKDESAYLTKSFEEGFDLGYRGPKFAQLTSPNLKFTVGNKTELWNKVMKEVELGRYAGPFESIPFEFFIQSPIGLVPKDGGRKTRLIFHLSCPKDDVISVNANTPDNLTTTSYPEFEEAIRLCVREGKGCFAGKTDLSSAFRHCPIHKKFWKYLVMKAQDPKDNRWYYFFDKCLPFGAAISCAIFQRFSDALAHILRVKTGRPNINYLDDFFVAALIKAICDGQLKTFIHICQLINFPVAMDKTFWGSTEIVFLGLLIDTLNQLIRIPVDKVSRAVNKIQYVLSRTKNKIKLKELQQLCGFLNFLGKAIIPGRAFTRRIYAYGAKLSNPEHHLNVTGEMKMDLRAWLSFLLTPQIYNRPFFDYDNNTNSEFVLFATDASANPDLGAGGICNDRWFIILWNKKFMKKFEPSINYLELYAVTVGVLNWVHLFANRRITVLCDNMSVVYMINKTTSSCRNCMILIRLIVLHSLSHNVRITAHYVPSEENVYPDMLSRHQYNNFRKRSREEKVYFKGKPDPIPEQLWPMNKVWWECQFGSSQSKSLPQRKRRRMGRQTRINAK